MTDLDSLSPWVNESADLSKRCLTVAEKKWLAAEVLMERLSLADIRERHKIDKKRVSYYAVKVSRGLNLFNIGGRPPLLDGDSRKVIMDYMRGRTEFSDQEIKIIIRNECKESYQRRYSNTNPQYKKAYKRPSMTTVTRYMKNFRVLAANFE